MTERSVALGSLVTARAGVGFPPRLQGRECGRYPFAKVGDISAAGRIGETISTARHFVDEGDLQVLHATPFPPGTIFFAKIGEAIRQNHRVMSTVPMLIDNNAMGLIPSSPDVHPKYLFRFLGQVDFYKLANATTVPAIRKSRLEALLVPLPPLDEQKRIAAILDKVDAIRRKRKEAIALTEELLRSVFLEMFGDPVTNPKGWGVRPLGELVRTGEKINYGVVQPGGQSEDGIPLVRVKDIFGGAVSTAKLRRVSAEIDERHKQSRLLGDEILIACVGSIGTIALASPSLRGMNIARAIARVALDRTKVSRRYVAEFLRAASVQRYFRNETRTVAQPTLNIKQIKETPVLVPPVSMQKVFGTCASGVEATLNRHAAALCEADDLFCALSQQFFSPANSSEASHG